MQDTSLRQKMHKAREGQSRIHGFLPQELAAFAFPAARTTELKWVRVNGDYRFIVTAGSITEADEEATETSELPSGKYARAALLYLCTRAKLTGSETIDVGTSYRQFINDMGLPWQGARRSGEALRQLMLVSAATIRISSQYIDEDGELRSGAISTTVAEETLLWTNPGRTKLSDLKDSIMTLSPAFMRMLERAVPISMPAWRWLLSHSRSPMALDIYLWLCVRLPRCEKTTRVTWAQLHDQFGSTVALSRFKQVFRAALDVALTVYPEARIRETTGEHRRRGFKGFYLSASPDPRDAKLPEAA